MAQSGVRKPFWVRKTLSGGLRKKFGTSLTLLIRLHNFSTAICTKTICKYKQSGCNCKHTFCHLFISTQSMLMRFILCFLCGRVITIPLWRHKEKIGRYSINQSILFHRIRLKNSHRQETAKGRMGHLSLLHLL